MLLHHCIAFTGKDFRSDLSVRLSENRVTETGPFLQPLPGEKVLDLQGDYLLPGFVDVHIHAFRKHDTMQGESAIRAMSRDLAEVGVAAFCPTTMSASPEDTRLSLRGIRAVMICPESHGALVLGAHMEAPFLQESKAGAQRKEFFQDPSWDALLEMTDGHPESVRLITMAPERAGAELFIQKATSIGIHISIGHTSATAAQVHAAADWGADHVTHTFNAQTPLHHREPGVPGAALTDDRLCCELICDGVHLHGDIVRLIVRCKGAAQSVAITDAMEAAGMPDGVYSLGGQKVFVKAGEARLKDGTLAGSVLTMKQALHNLIHRFGIDPAIACAMCTSTPAASIGNSLAGRIQPGSPGILTRWSKDWELVKVISCA